MQVDWRTGKPMPQHDDAFWRDHERRRAEQGLSVPQYCAANGLALSTFRHRVSGKQRRAAAAAPKPGTFGAVSCPQQPSTGLLEIVLEGMTLRVSGEAAERVLARVMARLA